MAVMERDWSTSSHLGPLRLGLGIVVVVFMVDWVVVGFEVASREVKVDVKTRLLQAGIFSRCRNASTEP